MKYTHLGRTGTSVSRIVLGTMNFGDRTSEEDSFAIMDRALELGVNFFDTANAYGGSAGRGATEEIIGRWFAARPGVRDDIVLATKVHSPMVAPTDDGADVVNARGASAWQVRREAIRSLERLQTDRIDLYQFHHIDRHISWQELWQAMEVLVARGEVVYTGSSNFAAWNIAQANEVASQRHFLGLVSEQSLYNLAQRSIELEVIPAAQHYGLGILPWSPLSGGLLSGGSSDRRARSGEVRITVARAKQQDQLDAYDRFAAERGWSSASLGLAWLLHQPGVTGPIIGPRTLEQLESAVAAVDIELSADDLAALDELFPGPGGQAPEAYAW
ncbi:MAG TPA: aldo/keto reductase [Plantibacter sp.]|uniref:aldo/keto reductase n=1 Tax=unclassified Plantibacter TaxID=2624265 RepID=UPI002BC8D5CD|nr:aldo/keto reductase [Plantibacter sp.]